MGSKSIIGKIFVAVISLLYVLSYYTISQTFHDLSLLSLVLFHLFFVMLLWSYIHVVISEPGKVPAYWVTSN